MQPVSSLGATSVKKETSLSSGGSKGEVRRVAAVVAAEMCTALAARVPPCGELPGFGSCASATRPVPKSKMSRNSLLRVRRVFMGFLQVVLLGLGEELLSGPWS